MTKRGSDGVLDIKVIPETDNFESPQLVLDEVKKTASKFYDREVSDLEVAAAMRCGEFNQEGYCIEVKAVEALTCQPV